MARPSKSSAPQWPLDREGYVCHWMVSGPVMSGIGEVAPSGDQFDVEECLREAVAGRTPEPFAPEVGDGRDSRLGQPWRFAGGRDGAFVNLSDFYPRLCWVRFDAATGLVAKRALDAEVALWSYAAADVYLNGVRVGGVDAPRYKPIRRVLLSLRLREGVNTLYVACETLGARDTRSVIGVQLLTGRDAVRATLPDAKFAAAVGPALDFLDGIALADDCLRFPGPAPVGSRAAWSGGFEPDFARAILPTRWLDVGGLDALPLEDGEPWVTLQIPTESGTLSRKFERTGQIVPKRLPPALDFDENLRCILRRVAAVESLNRDGQFGFPIANILARKALGESGPRDEALLFDMLSLIEKRVDCADFLVCGLMRYLRSYPVGEALSARIREVLQGWRYWMDMDGADGMCFWSENHALMFYSCAMFAGGMYPRDWFPRARMSGEELRAWGRARVLEWLEDVERWGFEEFLSGIYMCLTFVALLNLIDYAEDGIAARATALADRLRETDAPEKSRSSVRRELTAALRLTCARIQQEVQFSISSGEKDEVNVRPDAAVGNEEPLEDFCRWCVNAAQQIERQRGKTGHNAVIGEVCAYLDANYADKQLSLCAVAERFGFSETYFSRLFKAQTGATYSEYLERLRVKRACELLLAGESVDRVADSMCKLLHSVC